MVLGCLVSTMKTSGIKDIKMSYSEKAAAIIFFVCGFFIGGLGGLTLGANLTLSELTSSEATGDKDGTML